MEKVIVTGSSGFIGMHLCIRLIKEGYMVHGIDNMNDYYDTSLKFARLKILNQGKNFSFSNVDITKTQDLAKIFRIFKPDKVVNLAGQASVPYSIKNPMVYIQSNVVGFMNILELCKTFSVKGLIYASSSSVYGSNDKMPFSEKDNVDKPQSIYAASKKSNELMASSYSYLFGLNSTGLRFFSVYGPWGRPDMAIYIFTERILKGKPITIFNKGCMYRDFTYIDDIVEGTMSSLKKNYRCEIFNLGNGHPESILEIIRLIENVTGKKAKIYFEKMRLGDVEKTYADLSHSGTMLNYKTAIRISEGVPNFISWYNNYMKSKNGS